MTTRTALLSVIALLALSLAASLVLYPQLPERLPTHWNVHGEVDGWTGKALAAVLLPALVLLPLLLIAAGEWLSPLHFRIEPFRGAFNTIMVILASLTVYVYGIALLAALHPGRSYGRWLVGGIFLFFAWMANLFGKVRRNFFLGIRTPWTLASDRVWIATHRLAARMLMAVGVAGAVCVWAGVPLAACFVLLMLGLLIPVFWSLRLSKKLDKEGESHQPAGL